MRPPRLPGPFLPCPPEYPGTRCPASVCQPRQSTAARLPTPGTPDTGILRLRRGVHRLLPALRRLRHCIPRLHRRRSGFGRGLPRFHGRVLRLRRGAPHARLRRVIRRHPDRERGVRLLFRGRAATRLELAGLLVSAARELRVDVPEIGVDDGVRLAFQGREQNLARVLEPPFDGVEHREIVVRLGHFGVIAAQRHEDVDGFAYTARAGAENSVQQACTAMARLTFQQRIEHLPGVRIALLGGKRERALKGFVAGRGAG